MKRLTDSKVVAAAAFCIVIAYMVLTFRLRFAWWTFIDEFFAFMMVFTHLMALFLARFNPFVRRKLDTCAMVFGLLFIISLIAEFVIFQLS